jgi:hypothetical protein
MSVGGDDAQTQKRLPGFIEHTVSLWRFLLGRGQMVYLRPAFPFRSFLSALHLQRRIAGAGQESAHAGTAALNQKNEHDHK